MCLSQQNSDIEHTVSTAQILLKVRFAGIGYIFNGVIYYVENILLFHTFILN